MLREKPYTDAHDQRPHNKTKLPKTPTLPVVKEHQFPKNTKSDRKWFGREA